MNTAASTTLLGGLGIVVGGSLSDDGKEKVVVVKGLQHECSAMKCGMIQVGDRIVAANNTQLRTAGQAIGVLRGPVDTQVRIDFERGGQLYALWLKRTAKGMDYNADGDSPTEDVHVGTEEVAGPADNLRELLSSAEQKLQVEQQKNAEYTQAISRMQQRIELLEKDSAARHPQSQMNDQSLVQESAFPMKADQKQPVSSSSFSSAPLSPSSSPSVTAKIVFLKEFDDTRRPKMAVEDSKRKGSNIVNEHEFNDILNISQEDRTSGCERLLQNVFRCHLIANMLQETSEMVEDQVNEETCGAVKSFAGMTTTGLALDGVEVAHVMVGSEAFKSNKIHAGDVILSVNDQVATTWNVKSVLDARDRAGETVKLRVRSARNSEITEVTIPRQSCADLPQHALLSHYLTLAREDAEQEGSADKHHLITAAMAVWSKIARKAQAKEGKALVRSQEQASRIQQCSASLSPLLEKIHLDIVFLQEELGRAYRYIDELKLSAGKQTLNSSPARQLPRPNSQTVAMESSLLASLDRAPFLPSPSKPQTKEDGRQSFEDGAYVKSMQVTMC